MTLTTTGEQVRYEIHSTEGGAKVVHCQGRAVWTRQPERTVDVDALRRQMTQVSLHASTVYPLLAERGLALGESFRSVTSIQLGSNELLADLQMPESAAGNAYVLHPALMDGSLHGSLGLLDGWTGRPEQARVPFTLESLLVVAPCTPSMVAWMRYSDGCKPGDPVARLDVDLCDRQGRLCVRMRGFTSRAIGTSPDAPKGELVTLAPVWNAVPVQIAEPLPQRVVVIGGTDEQHRELRRQCAVEVLSVDGGSTIEQIASQLRNAGRVQQLVWILPATGDDLIAAQQDGALLGFRLVKALLGESYGARPLVWTVVTTATQKVRGEDVVRAAHASIHGLIGSMAHEYRNWSVRAVDVDGDAAPWNEILRLPFDQRGDGWAVREGQWYRRSLVPCDPANAGSAIQRGGVYVVIGGAGGLGEVLSEHLTRNHDARVIWIGRREKDAAIEEKLRRIPAHYIAADARNRDDLQRACDEVKERFGRINGVIHSAVVLADKSLANMDESQFRTALSTKVDTAVRMVEVFGREPLDFLLYFSSLQSFLKAPGQSNYAAGCTFTDALAEASAASYPVKVMNWGYWGTVGVATTADHRERMARIGWGSLEPAEGMAAVERLLSGPLPQLGVIRTIGDQALRSLGVGIEERQPVAARAIATTLPSSGLRD
ncbi:MAG TPA: SDR family oxidoreductase, partial [Thermoanaerobaculia bacterium]